MPILRDSRPAAHRDCAIFSCDRGHLPYAHVAAQRIVDAHPDLAFDVALATPDYDAVPQVFLRWNPDPHRRTDRATVSYEERVATLVGFMSKVWAQMERGELEPGITYVYYLFYPARAMDAIEAARRSNGMRVFDVTKSSCRDDVLKRVAQLNEAIETQRELTAKRAEEKARAVETRKANRKRRMSEDAGPSGG